MFSTNLKEKVDSVNTIMTQAQILGVKRIKVDGLFECVFDEEHIMTQGLREKDLARAKLKEEEVLKDGKKEDSDHNFALDAESFDDSLDRPKVLTNQEVKNVRDE